MSVNSGEPASPAPQTRFSADGFWWWDGAEWKPAISPDRRWRWNGTGWVPAPAPRGTRSGTGMAIGLIAGVFVIVLLLVGAITIAVVLLLGGHLGGASSATVGG